MKPKYAVVAIHGINGESGKTQQGFSNPLADLVIPQKSLKEKFWHEAVWEGICDDLDKEIKKIVTELICSYNFEDYFVEKMEGKSGFKKILPSIGVFATLFAKDVISDLIASILDYALDLPLYLGGAYGCEMRSIVEEKIKSVADETGQKVVVVSHSLGSVIAYDAVAKLSAGEEDSQVAALVTMGSPLAWVSRLRKKRKCADELLTVPDSLKWLNFYNKIDPVPLKKGLPAEAFPSVENIETAFEGKKPLVAHSAYWTDDQVVKAIQNIVGWKDKKGSR